MKKSELRNLIRKLIIEQETKNNMRRSRPSTNMIKPDRGSMSRKGDGLGNKAIPLKGPKPAGGSDTKYQHTFNGVHYPNLYCCSHLPPSPFAYSMSPTCADPVPVCINTLEPGGEQSAITGMYLQNPDSYEPATLCDNLPPEQVLLPPPFSQPANLEAGCIYGNLNPLG